MNHLNLDLPGRLKVAGASDLERRFLEAAGREKPSLELKMRMAASIGISSAILNSSAAGSTSSIPAADSVIPGVTAAKTTSLTLFSPWVVVSGILSMIGTIVGVAVWKDTIPKAPTDSPTIYQMQPAAPSATEKTANQEHAPSLEGDLREQILLIDKARAAVTNGTNQPALEILRRYQEAYPQGSFQPEAQALKIEALANLGRLAEARMLAKQFIAVHGSSPLVERVANATRLQRP